MSTSAPSSFTDPAAAAAPSATPLLDAIIASGKMVRDVTTASTDPKELAAIAKRRADEKNFALDMVGAFVDQVVQQKGKIDSATEDSVKAIETMIAAIDQSIGAQLDEILHYKKFQELEARWRGLNYLVMNSETGTSLKIRVLNTSKKELGKDLEAAVEFDRSTLFKKVYEEEYGTFGGDPFGLLVGDYEFEGSGPDVAMLTNLSGVAASAHAPFLAAASPGLFDMDSFTTLDVPGDLGKLFERTPLALWRAFRQTDDSRYVALTLPRSLLRPPYGEKTAPVEGFRYEEKAVKHEDFLWGNTAYPLAQRINNAFSMYHWCAAIRGVEGGGLVEGLPFYTFKSAGEDVIKCPTETAITDRRENELSEQGLLALCYKKGTNQAAFFGGSTANKPTLYNTNSANANARLSAQLPYILATSRFAHYIKVMMRDKVGSFATRENIANYLNNWIADYVLLNDSAGQETKARLPLREARVDVTDVPGKPGAYRAIVFLRPHFQLNELSVSMRLVAELPPPAA
jgi:type VI secretion system protein ImpC